MAYLGKLHMTLCEHHSQADTPDRSFFPVILQALRQTPIIGTFLSLPYIRQVSPLPASHDHVGPLTDGTCRQLIDWRVSGRVPSNRNRGYGHQVPRKKDGAAVIPPIHISGHVDGGIPEMLLGVSIGHDIQIA